MATITNCDICGKKTSNKENLIVGYHKIYINVRSMDLCESCAKRIYNLPNDRILLKALNDSDEEKTYTVEIKSRMKG